MRLEELMDNRTIKTPDHVERYLLQLVRDYFDNNVNFAPQTSREYIIKKAVERMREEVVFNTIGVLSIVLPNGEIRTGEVKITLDDLNGEPLIENKLSAFNVNFGTTKGTACEGNDIRLYDDRKPLEHVHELSDVIGLNGILSTLKGKLERMDGSLHEHNNKKVIDMLVYTGNHSSIDLASLETLESKVIKLIDSIQEDFINYRHEVNSISEEMKQENIIIKNLLH